MPAPSRSRRRGPVPCPSARRSEADAMDLAPHTGFILGSYAFTALVLGGLILNAVRDQRAQKRALTELQAGERAGDRA